MAKLCPVHLVLLGQIRALELLRNPEHILKYIEISHALFIFVQWLIPFTMDGHTKPP